MLGYIFRSFIPNPTCFSFFVYSLASAIFSALDVSVDLQYQTALQVFFNRERIAIQNESKLLQPHDMLLQNRSFLLFKLHVESVELLSVLDWD